MKEQDKITKEQLELEYKINNLSIAEICNKYNMKPGTIKILIKKYNLTKNRSDIARKIQNSIIKKYGVDNVSKLDSIKEKKKATVLLHYGVDNPMKSEEIKNKVKNTEFKKYGSQHMRNKNILSKMKKTNIERYGVEISSKSQEVKDKMKQTNLERYGVLWTGQIPSTRIKAKDTMIKKYGTAAPTANIGKSKEYINIYENDVLFINFIKNTVNGKTIIDISKLIGYSESAILQKVHKLQLDDYVDIKPRTSQYETEIYNFILSLDNNIKIEKNIKILDNKDIDIYLPEYKIGIEFNGYYWHSSIYKDKKYHQNKSLLAEEKGIRLIHIYENEWIDPIKNNILKSLLCIALGKTKSRIYARNCEIKEITNAEAKPFNDANHLQGHRNASITYGLYYNSKLVQLMSFSKHGKYDWEIIRGCPGSNNIVVGGVGKLFKHFIKEKDPKQVFSYCDFNKFDGKSYESIGMNYIGLTQPDLKYIVNGIVINRNPSAYKENKNSLKLYGAGSKKYLWIKEKTEN